MSAVTRVDSSKVLKIAIVDTTAAGGLIGGAQTFLVEFLRGLVQRGHDVHFVTIGEPNERIRPQLMSTGSTIHTDLIEPGGLVDDRTALAARRLEKLTPDVYVVSVSGDVGWTVLPFLRAEIATLMIGHSDNEAFYAPLRHYSRFVTRAVGVSEEICGCYVEACGVPPERVDWIPYGVSVRDRPLESNVNEPIRLVFVGRLEETHKRASDLIKIAKILSQRGIDYSFDVVGDGALFASFLLSLAEEIENGRVKMHTWVGSDTVIEILQKTDVFLLTSDSEGFCIALTEAMANGCCPVVTDIRSGNKQLVRDGDNGFIVPVGDIGAFVDRIELLANDRHRLLKMRHSAWETGRQYGIDRMVDAYEDCFRRAIDDARANPRTSEPDFPLMLSCRSRYPLWLRRIKARAKNLL